MFYLYIFYLHTLYLYCFILVSYISHVGKFLSKTLIRLNVRFIERFFTNVIMKESPLVADAVNSCFIYEKEFHKFRASSVRRVIIIRTQEKSSMQHNAYIFSWSCHSMQQTLYIVTRKSVCVCVCIYACIYIYIYMRVCVYSAISVATG